MNNITAVIFDMDGVLVDSEPANFEALRRVLARHGHRYTEAENVEFIGLTDHDHLTRLRERYRLEPSVDELVQQWLDLALALVPARTVPMPGVDVVIAELLRRGYGLAVASSAQRAVIEARLTALGVRSAFSVIVSAEDVAQGKPAPDIFLEAARRLGVPPHRCLVVEDSGNGVLAAKAAGMLCAVMSGRVAGERSQSLAGDVGLSGLPDLLPVLPKRR